MPLFRWQPLPLPYLPQEMAQSYVVWRMRRCARTLVGLYQRRVIYCFSCASRNAEASASAAAEELEEEDEDEGEHYVSEDEDEAPIKTCVLCGHSGVPPRCPYDGLDGLRTKDGVEACSPCCWMSHGLCAFGACYTDRDSHLRCFHCKSSSQKST